MRVIEADLFDVRHGESIVALLAHYAEHPYAGGEPLPESSRRRLVEGLRSTPGCRVFLAEDGVEIVGICVCFSGFSTFAAQPLLNVHDLAVHESRRGQGIGRALLTAAVDAARAGGCCRVTLEVHAQNGRAKGLYSDMGFRASQEFWRLDL